MGEYLTHIDNSVVDPNNMITSYLMGLIATDGYVNYKHNRISIRMTYNGAQQLFNNLKQYYNSTTPIRIYEVDNNYKKGCKSYDFSFSHTKLHSILKYYDIPLQNKTWDIRFPYHLPKENMYHYLRGIYDGDGCFVQNGKKSNITSASEIFIDGLRDALKDLGFKTSKELAKRKLGVYYSCIMFKGETIKFCKEVYSNNRIKYNGLLFCLPEKLDATKIYR